MRTEFRSLRLKQLERALEAFGAAKILENHSRLAEEISVEKLRLGDRGRVFGTT